jgi:hypothetical protein
MGQPTEVTPERRHQITSLESATFFEINLESFLQMFSGLLHAIGPTWEATLSSNVRTERAFCVGDDLLPLGRVGFNIAGV